MSIGFQVCWVELRFNASPPLLHYQLFIIVIVRETVNADSSVSFEQDYFKILCIFFVILVAGAGFEPFVG